tara:strand:+ start:9046 stop:10278 length:1233 start_codon:yes stop_codon:yes gene_type:complete
MTGKGMITVLAGVLLAGSAAQAADLAPETPYVESLPDTSRDHWVAVGDLNPLGNADTRVMLYDADTGKMLGMMSTGYWGSLSFFPKDSKNGGKKNIVTLETYFERGTRGQRRDYAVIYDGITLLPIHEIGIAPRRMTGFTQTQMGGLSDDGQFLAVTNFTPAQSVSIVNLAGASFADEVPTAGCGQIYPAGNRRFALLCGDGAMRMLTIDDAGAVRGQTDSEPFFDPFTDPVLVQAARKGNDWFFVSMDGYIHDVDVSGDTVKLKEKWSLLSDDEREDGWRTGGIQALAIHEADNKLYALMRQGGRETYEEPCDVVWVFDLATHKRVATIDLVNTTLAINVSPDAKPILTGASFKTVLPYWSLALVSILGAKFEELDVVKPALDVYDATSGAHLRTVDHAANFATSLTQP